MDVDDVELARLIEEALAARRVVTPDTVDAVEEPLRTAAEAGAPAVDAGLQMLRDPDRDVRAVGCELLAECCNGREAPTGRIVEALVELAADETDGEVHWSLAQALGVTREPAAIPALVALAGHNDEDVRFQVACSLPDTADGQVDGQLRELRCHYGRDLYRILYQRSGNLFILLHAIEKRTGLLPQADIDIAKERFEDFRQRMNRRPRRPPRAAGHDAP